MKYEAHFTEHDLAVLDARTRALAEAATAPDRRTAIDVIVLRIAGERYGMDSGSVHAVAALERLTPLPHAPPEVAGITSRAGTILPVFDLRAALGLTLTSLPEYGRIVLLGEGDPDGLIALAVEAVEGVERVVQEELRDVPATVAPGVRTLLQGLTPEGLPVIDAAALLASSRFTVDIAPPRA